METNENVIFKNHIGSVTNKKIVLNYKNGTEELPIGQVTSISYQHIRNYPFAIGGFLVAIGGLYAIFFLGAGPTELLIFFLLVVLGLLSGIANWLGHHNIIISTAGKNRKPLKVEMSKVKEGREFVDAVIKAIL